MCIDEAVISNDNYLKYAFNSFDLNGDGKIQREEFQLVLHTYSKDFICNEELVNALMFENDMNKDGVVDFEEFKTAIVSVKEKLGTKIVPEAMGSKLVAEVMEIE